MLDVHGVKIPFGVGQVGKSFRNEITPKQFTFRSREFEQMEIEFFCHPKTSQQWYTYTGATAGSSGISISRRLCRKITCNYANITRRNSSHYSCGNR